METNEALPTRETNPADFADEDIIRKGPKLKEWIRAFGVVYMSCKVNFYVIRSALIDANLWHTCHSF